MHALSEQIRGAGADVCQMKPVESADPGQDSDSSDEFGPHAVDQIMFQGHVDASRSKALIFQYPYLEKYPSWVGSALRTNNTVYAGYGIPLSTWEHGLYNGPIIKNLSIFIASSNRDAWKMKTRNPTVRVLKAGNPLLWQLRNSPSPHEVSIDVLWAPHWTQSWFDESAGYSTFLDLLPAMCMAVSKKPALKFVCRPHPLLEKALWVAEGGDPQGLPETVTQTARALVDSPNFELWHTLTAAANFKISRSSMLQDICAARALISDGVSILAYWAATGKRVFVPRSKNTSRFNGDGNRLMKTLLSGAPDEKNLLSFLTEVEIASEPLLDMQKVSRRLHPTGRVSPGARLVECF